MADDITQGLATGDMFRTTSLWGVGQRMFFLHDGRTNDLLQAIRAHESHARDCDSEHATGCYGPSEANTVIERFGALAASDKRLSWISAIALAECLLSRVAWNGVIGRSWQQAAPGIS
ncbi:MAG: hypothetical protein WCE52_16195 [Candidatus Acidiferrum sp.]